MRIHYYADTDTVHVHLNDNEIVETQELNENTLLDMDVDGNLVAITLEHACETANIHDFSFQQAAVLQLQDA